MYDYSTYKDYDGMQSQSSCLLPYQTTPPGLLFHGVLKINNCPLLHHFCLILEALMQNVRLIVAISWEKWFYAV